MFNSDVMRGRKIRVLYSRPGVFWEGWEKVLLSISMYGAARTAVVEEDHVTDQESGNLVSQRQRRACSSKESVCHS
jgi:hypothetical protein